MLHTLNDYIDLKHITAAICYSIIGIIMLSVAFYVFDKITPGNLWKEIVEEQNIALAITTAAMMLAIGNIITSAILS